MIYAHRIRLRKATRTDLPDFVRWLNDPEVRQGISLYLPISPEEEDRWFENMLERPIEEQPLVIEMREGEDWRLIGNCGLFQFNYRSRSAEFGIVIGDKTVWNQGYGTEATRLVLRHAFHTLNLYRVFLRVLANNPRARRAYEKAGFTLEGTLRQAEFMDGAYIDVHLMSVLRPEWKEG